MKKNICVIIADDHYLFRQGVERSLRRIKYISKIFQAATGKDVLVYADKEKVDVVLMDLRMPLMNGYEASRLLSERYPHIKVIVLSMFDAQVNIDMMLELGAMGFITKNTSKDELEEAINTVMNGNYFFSDILIPETLHLLKRLKFPSDDKPRSYLPSPLQLKIIKQICAGKTNEEIAKENSISVDDIKYHRRQLLEKFGVSNTAEMIAYVFKNGLIDF